MPNDTILRSFNFIMPVEAIEKADDGEWRIRGCASTEELDQQGEIVKMCGLDITPLKEGDGILNWNHSNLPENILGVIDKSEIENNKLMIEGYLLKNSERAKHTYNMMTSFKPADKKRVGLSVEGKVLRRIGADNKIIAAARVDKIAMTIDPVNRGTYAELVKSLEADNKKLEAGEYLLTEEESLDKALQEMANKIAEKFLENIHEDDAKKALAAGDYNVAPSERKDGAALQMESKGTSKKKKKGNKKKLKEKLFETISNHMKDGKKD